MKLTILTLSALSLMCASSNAALINFDFGGRATAYTGEGVIGAAGDAWNSIDGNGTIATVVDSSGATVSGASLTVAGTLGGVADAPNITVTGPTGGNVDDLMKDYNFVDTDPATVTLLGLVPNEDYTLYILAVDNESPRNMTFSVTGGSSQTVNTGGTGGSDRTGNLTILEDYAVFTGNTGAAGTVEFTYSSTSFGASNGFQLETSTSAVPEPSSLLALAFGGFLAFGRRR